MEIKITVRQTLNILLVIAWIIFIGLCIEAGGLLVNAVFAIANPDVVPRLWREIDLSGLFKFDHGHFFAMTLIIGITAAMKAWLFYLIIHLLQNRQLNMTQPFSRKVGRFIFYVSYLALLIGMFSAYGARYAGRLAGLGVSMPDTQYLRVGGADVWLFMAVVLFVIAQIFKRGIEIQSENDLTI